MLQPPIGHKLMTTSEANDTQSTPAKGFAFLLSKLGKLPPSVLLQVLITSVAVVFILSTSYFLPTMGMKVIRGHMLGPLPVLSAPALVPNFSTIVPNANAQRRLTDQLNEIRALERHHFESMLFVHTLAYMAIHQVLTASAVSAACLFLITKLGWDNSSVSLKNFFLSFAAIAAIASAYPQVFKYSENIAQNKFRYLEYAALDREIQTFMLTGRFRAKSSGDPVDLIVYIDSELRRLDDFSLLMDVSSLPKVRIDSDTTRPDR